MKKKKKIQFTLIELLIVIAIIAILSAILLPALHKARELASKVTCINNQKQLGLSFMNYCDDNSGYPPTIYLASTNQWNNKYYLNQLYDCGYISTSEWKKSKMDMGGVFFGKNPITPCMLVCPTGLKLQRDNTLNTGGYGGSYGINIHLRSNSNIGKIKKPSVTLCLAEKGPNVADIAYLHVYDLSQLQYGERYIHNRSTNVVFMDFHIESLGYSQNKNWIVIQNP